MVGLKNESGTYISNIPLYVKLSEIQGDGLENSQNEIIRRISEIFIQGHQSEFSDYIKRKKKESAKRNKEENHDDR